MTALISFLPQIITAQGASYTQETVTVDYDEQVTDSFCGVEAKYVTYTSNSGEFSCAGYVKNFYREIFGVDVFNINIVEDKPSVYCEGKTVELKAVTTPQPGDIMQDKDYSHVAIVKDCTDGEVTLIEQNYKWTYNDEIYTVVNRKVIQDRHYYYRLYIDGVEQSLDMDKTAPVISSMKSENVTKSGFTVSAKITDNKAVTKLKVTVSTAGNSANDTVTKTYTNPSQSFTYTVKTKNFASRDDNYIVTFTAYDDAGNVTEKTVKTYVDTTAPTISSAKSSDKSAKGYTLTFSVSDKSAISKAEVTAWADSAESSTKYTYTPEISGSTGKFTLLTKNHGNKTGVYRAKITVTDKYGNVTSKTYKTTLNPATGVKLDKSSLTLAKGKTQKLTATMSGKSITDYVSYKTSDSAVATVSSSGKITAKGVGKATVTAYTTGGKTAKCTVTVTDSISSAKVKSIDAQIYTGSKLTPTVTVTYGGEALKKGTDYTLSYSSNTDIGKAYVTLKGKGLYTGSKKVSFNIIPNGIKGLSATASGTTVKISYKAVKGADKYVIFRYNSSKDSWDKLTTTTSLSYSDKNRSAGKTYKYRVKAITTADGVTYSGQYASTFCVTAPAQTSCKAVSTASGSIDVTWDSSSGATGYQVYISDSGESGTFKKVTATKNKSGYTITGVSSYSLKFIKIRPYRTSEGTTVYGKYSSPVMVMVK
jgi:hypothetical protein